MKKSNVVFFILTGRVILLLIFTNSIESLTVWSKRFGNGRRFCGFAIMSLIDIKFCVKSAKLFARNFANNFADCSTIRRSRPRKCHGGQYRTVHANGRKAVQNNTDDCGRLSDDVCVRTDKFDRFTVISTSRLRSLVSRNRPGRIRPFSLAIFPSARVRPRWFVPPFHFKY